jgi:hypothetical protein
MPFMIIQCNSIVSQFLDTNRIQPARYWFAKKGLPFTPGSFYGTTTDPVFKKSIGTFFPSMSGVHTIAFTVGNPGTQFFN